MNGAFELSLPWWEFVLRGIAVYLAVLIMLRLTGKRSFGEMSAFDIVVLMVVGGSLRTAIIGKDASLIGPLIAVAAILATNKALGWISARWPAFDRAVEGRPAIVIRDGRRDNDTLRRENVARAEFERALHGEGLEDESTIELGRLEPNGKITMIKKQ